MTGRPLSILVLSQDGARLGDEQAQLRLTSESGGEPITIPFEDGQFRLPSLSSGTYRLQARGDGFHSQVRRLRMHAKPTQETVVLRPVPEAVPGSIGVVFRESRVDLPPGLESLVEGQVDLLEKPAAQFSLEMVEPLAIAASGLGTRDFSAGDFLELTSRAELAQAGPLFQRTENSLTVVTPRISVKFRPEVSEQETREICDHHGLDAQSLVPLPFAPNLFLASLQKEEQRIATEVAESMSSQEPRVVYAEAEIDGVLALDASTAEGLRLPGWDRELVLSETQRRRIAGSSHTAAAFGDPDLTLCVIDTPIVSIRSMVPSPEVEARATPATLRVLRELGSRTQPEDHHGVAMASVAVGVSIGMAPGCRLLWIPNSPEDELQRHWLPWAAGLRRLQIDGLEMEPPEPGAAIFVGTSGWGAGQSLSQTWEDLIDFLTTFGRNGKGCLFFASAGNTSSNELVSLLRPVSAYEKTLACGATTSAQGDGEPMPDGETLADYSAQGRGLDFCAPSSRVISPRRPQDNGTRASTFAGGGVRGVDPLVVTSLAARSEPQSTVLLVDDTAGLSRISHLWIGGENPEWARVERNPEPGDTEVAVSSPFPRPGSLGLLFEHAAGDPVCCWTRVVTRLTERVLASPESEEEQVLEVESTDGISVGDRLSLVRRAASDLLGRDATVKVTRVEQNRLIVSALPAESLTEEELLELGLTDLGGVFPRGTLVVLATDHLFELFGGTSSATGLCAGLGALVLSANPELTWVEARDVLRRTARRIDYPGPDWSPYEPDPSLQYSDRFGFGRVRGAEAIWRALELAATPPNRYLLIRNHLDDQGDQPSTGEIDSPDLWVREAASEEDFSALDYEEENGPHQNPDRSSTHRIYARVRNRGEARSLEAWVRFLLVSSNGEPFRYPRDWMPPPGSQNPVPGVLGPGIYPIGDVGIPALEPGEWIVVSHEWAATLRPDDDGESGPEWFLLVDVVPHGGPLQEERVTANNNLAQRRLRFEP